MNRSKFKRLVLKEFKKIFKNDKPFFTLKKIVEENFGLAVELKRDERGTLKLIGKSTLNESSGGGTKEIIIESSKDGSGLYSLVFVDSKNVHETTTTLPSIVDLLTRYSN